MTRTRSACLACGLVALAAAAGRFIPTQIIEPERRYLSTPGQAEWSEFDGRPSAGRDYRVTFHAEPNDREYALFIRQRDVKLDWTVQLNGRKLGRLHTMEQPLVHALPVPAGVLRGGENTLSITPPAGIDDVIVGEIKLEPRPVREALGLATVAVEVVDREHGGGVPCRITVVDSEGALAALYAEAEQALAVRPGVVYTPDGRAAIGLPPGSYTMYASRGFEYGVDATRFDVADGDSRTIRLRIAREVPTPGLVSCDTHIHTLTHSGHGDASIDERAITIAAEGIELAIATEHNLHADYSDAAKKTRVADRFTPAIGNEVTTKKGHFNAFPIRPDSAPPDHRIEDWPALVQAIRSTPGVRVVVLNHPRNVHSGFQPLGPEHFNSVTGENRSGPEFTFDAVEVVTSAALQSDAMIGLRDWFALLNYGYRIAAMGSSDSHDVSRYILGQGRTYVACADDDPGAIDVEAACRGILEGRVHVSMGLLVHMTVNGRSRVGDLANDSGDTVRVEVQVLGPSWARADRVQLFANGNCIRDEAVEATESIEKARVTWTIPRPGHDVHLVAVATGPGVAAPFWAIPRPYQPSSREWVPRVVGATNPIWLDADRDGRFTSPRGYAERLVGSGVDATVLLQQLRDYDVAVAAQAASLLHASGADLRGERWSGLVAESAAPTREGFMQFVRSLEGR